MYTDLTAMRELVADFLDGQASAGMCAARGVGCPHCEGRWLLIHTVLPEEDPISDLWTVYECLRCGATETLGDRNGVDMPPLFPGGPLSVGDFPDADYSPDEIAKLKARR